jgi:predicted RNA-binding protein
MGVRGAARISAIVAGREQVLIHKAIPIVLTQRLELTEMVEFKKPLDLKSLVGRLSFIANKKHWGNSLRISPRSIPKKDYHLIVSTASKLNA